MLIGRSDELGRVAELLDAARAGRGGALVVRGDPGIGKTAILDRAREQEGLLVLSASGVDSEAHLAFAALFGMVRPIIDRRAHLPASPRAALEAALGLGPPAVPDRFAPYSGAFALIEAVAADGPVLLTVDDAHWLDTPSLEPLRFIARRLEDLPVAVLVAERIGEGEEVALPDAGLLTLPALRDDDARALLAAAVAGDTPADVVGRVMDLARGNPLALIELPRTLTDDERRGRVALPEAIRVGEVIRSAFRRRLDPLDPEVRRAVLVIAVSGDDAIDPVLDACARIGAPGAAAARAAYASATHAMVTAAELSPTSRTAAAGCCRRRSSRSSPARCPGRSACCRAPPTSPRLPRSSPRSTTSGGS